MEEKLKNEIIEVFDFLTDVYDSVGIKLGNDKGLFIQVVDYREGMEYLIEINNIIQGAYEPCASCNTYSKFGDLDQLLPTVEEYLKANL